MASDVFDKATLDSFAGVPVTDEHPPVMLKAANAKKYSVGSIGESVRQDGDLVLASLAIHDEEAIKAVESGERSEVSCGYYCDLEEKPGVHEGQKYDAIQKNIRGNHVALVPKGRAGPDARIHLDAADAVEVQSTQTTHNRRSTDNTSRTTDSEQTTMEKVLINGVWVEVSAIAKQALEVERTRADEAKTKSELELKAATAKAEKETARADGLKEDLAKAEKAHKDAVDPKAMQAAIAARILLEGTARKVLGKSAKLDGLSEKEVKLKVLTKARPTANFEGKSDAYLDGAFEAIAERSVRADAEDDEDDDIEDKGGRKDALDDVRRELERTDDDDEGAAGEPAWMKADAEKSRAAYLKRMDEAPKKLTVGMTTVKQ